MAKAIRDPAVGQLVYPSYSPQAVARIVEIGDPVHASSGFWMVRIKRQSGVLEWRNTSGLRDFTALIDDHVKKIGTLRDYADKLGGGDE